MDEDGSERERETWASLGDSVKQRAWDFWGQQGLHLVGKLTELLGTCGCCRGTNRSGAAGVAANGPRTGEDAGKGGSCSLASSVNVAGQQTSGETRLTSVLASLDGLSSILLATQQRVKKNDRWRGDSGWQL
ncbi:hypothetical protein ACJRO7_016570 [Eucalyptus globulus]|uniref:Uncharacterized protein n=1 Tax=Eucalyptus globulus TaxID=34317 RepID=A0ABD3LHK5_EUCGL